MKTFTKTIPAGQPKNLLAAVFACAVLLAAIFCPPAEAEEAAPAQATATDQFPEQPSAEHLEILRDIFGEEQDSFVYRREGRPDPFLPFVQEKTVQQEIRPEENADESLSGLRQFEPNQLLLVAILFRGAKPVAMVQDPVGKGYMVTIGTMIGRHGTVEEIIPNAVVIKQAARTWDQEVYKRVEMVLRKEGEH